MTDTICALARGVGVLGVAVASATMLVAAAPAVAEDQVGGGLGGSAAGPVPCDPYYGRVEAQIVWQTPAGTPLEIIASPDPRARVGQPVRVGVVLRNCAVLGEPVATEYVFRAPFAEVQGLGRAFRFNADQNSLGLGRAVRRGSRISWPRGEVRLAPGTQQLVTAQVTPLRPGVFRLLHNFELSIGGSPFEGYAQPSQHSVEVIGKAIRPGAALGASARVGLRVCASAGARVLARAPSRRAARAGRPRVKLRPRRRVCSTRRLSRSQSRRALRLPLISSEPGPVTPPLPACPLTPGAQGPLLGRRSYCPSPAVVSVQAWIVFSSVPPELIGTGVAAIGRTLTFGRGDPQDTIEVGYVGTSGTLQAGARFQARMRCESAFGTRCFADPTGSDELFVPTGSSRQVSGHLRVAALTGDLDYITPWTTLDLAPLPGKVYGIAATIPEERARCDTRATPRVGCVYTNYTPTLGFPTSRVPEIAAHVTAAQAASYPGAPGQIPLTRTRPANIRDNRRLACPERIRRQYRRARPDGSCDEYPFASTNEGGANVSRANVAARQNSIQGGLIGGFYTSQRILTGDAFWVTATP